MKKKKRKGTRAGKHRPFSRYLERGWRARGEVGRADWRRGNRAEKRVAAERGRACFSQARSVVSCGIVGGLDRAEQPPWYKYQLAGHGKVLYLDPTKSLHLRQCCYYIGAAAFLFFRRTSLGKKAQNNFLYQYDSARFHTSRLYYERCKYYGLLRALREPKGWLRQGCAVSLYEHACIVYSAIKIRQGTDVLL